MTYRKNTLSFLIIALLIAPAVFARSGHIAALAVSEQNDSEGGIADMFLEIRPGSGAVFIESLPLTKLDTQISARFAKEIACERSRINCQQYDFFYVINIQSGLIGGPSAGGALTVLTYAVLEDLPIRNDTAMTGTIMAGGIIGPVGSVQTKVAAAARNGFTTVLIPSWSNDSGIPIEDRYEINVIKIKTLDEALTAFSGVETKPVQTLPAPKEYSEQMQRIAKLLCAHSEVLAAEYSNEPANQYYQRALNASAHGASYSEASLCFSASLSYQSAALANASVEQRKMLYRTVIKDRASIEKELESKNIDTIADLEIAMIVTQRLSDVQDELDILNISDPEPKSLAYAYERLETGRAWLSLINKIPSKELDLSDERISRSCRTKIAEAQERINYLSYMYPGYTEDLANSLRKAFEAAHHNESVLCLFEASLAKAEANALLTAIYVPTEEIPDVVLQKQAISDQRISEQLSKGVFPVLGFSYGEYSKELLSQEPYSASLYSDYSIELSALDIYFPEKRTITQIDARTALVLIVGICMGAGAGIIGSHFIHRSHRPKKRRITAPLPGKKR